MKKAYLKDKIESFDPETSDLEPVPISEIIPGIKKGWDISSPQNDMYYHIYRDHANKEYFVFKSEGTLYIKEIYKDELKAQWYKVE